jgi:hypothetical protein
MKKLLLILLLFSCESEKTNQIVFTPDSHYSNIGISWQRSNVLEYWVEFNESIVYDIGTDQSDKNKLFGLAKNVANWKHHSFRHSFWYDPSIDSVHIGAYVRDTILYGAQPKKVHLTSISHKESLYLRIEVKDTIVKFWAKDSYCIVPISKHDIKLFAIPKPYFGGDQYPPHEITLNYEILN